MKRAMRYTSLFICASLTVILLTPMALALTRRTHLSNFIESAKTPSGGYQSTALPNNETTGTPDLVSTSNAIKMSFFFEKTAADFIDTSSWILDNMKTASNGFRTSLSDTTATMVGMYLASMALNASKKLTSLADGPRAWIEARYNAISGGYDTMEGGITTTIATFYAVESLYFLNNVSTLHLHGSEIGTYFMNCHNPDGGFAAVIGQESTLESTWAAIAGLYRLSQLSEFSFGSFDTTASLHYVSQFYFWNKADTFNYGGYGTSDRATVRDTFYVQKTIALLGLTNPNATAVQDYLLSCQNIADGGFAEKNANSYSWTSSMITTYYAFEALETFDPELGMLNVEVWFQPFDFVLLIVILAIVIVVLAAAVHYYRKRHE